MKIKIRSKEHKFTIPVPNAMLFSKITARLIAKYARTDDLTVSKEQMAAILDELRKAKRLHGKMKIVEVNSADGDIVEITL
ncbi:MAG: hypothetical protein PHX37_03015 [Eubacteriales bacterium]|nr:hypothetical protein [Eubacteriales bacterium]